MQLEPLVLSESEVSKLISKINYFLLRIKTITKGLFCVLALRAHQEFLRPEAKEYKKQ